MSLPGDDKSTRDVAIKILPQLFVGDPGRIARFEREARLLASLNHPHIGAIYGIEDTGGSRALVLEFVANARLRPTEACNLAGDTTAVNCSISLPTSG